MVRGTATTPKFGPIIVSTASRLPTAMSSELISGTVRRRASGTVCSRARMMWMGTGRDDSSLASAVASSVLTPKKATGRAQTTESKIQGREARKMRTRSNRSGSPCAGSVRRCGASDGRLLMGLMLVRVPAAVHHTQG